MAAHKTPCQRRGTKSSSKAARAHSQNTTQFAPGQRQQQQAPPRKGPRERRRRADHRSGGADRERGAQQRGRAVAAIAQRHALRSAGTMRRRRPEARDRSTSNRWCPRSEILRMPLLTPKPRRFAHTPLTQPMSSRRMISKRLRTGREVLRLKPRNNVCSQPTRRKAETVRIADGLQIVARRQTRRQSAAMHDDRMISLGCSSDDPKPG